jgi:hypothetical protein
LTKEIFTLIAGLVLAFISATTIGLSKVLGHPANLFAIFFLVILALVAFAEDKDADARRLTTWLKRRDGPMIYTRTVQGLMRALDRLLMPGTAAAEPMPDSGKLARLDWLMTARAKDASDLQRLRRNPWSWPVYDAALKLAVAYPLLLVAAQWWVTGDATGLGAAILFPEEARIWLRPVLIGPVLMVVVFGILAATTAKPVYSRAAVYLMYVSALGPFLVQVLGPDLISGSVLFALAVTSGAAFAIAGGVNGAATAAVAVGLAVLTPLAVAYPITGSVAQGASFIVALAFSTLPLQFTYRARGGYGYALFTALLVLALVSTPTDIRNSGEDTRGTSIWLFLGLLPLMNALFDWLSYGLTIWLIRMGHRKKGLWTLVYGLVDAVSAVLLFFALSLTLTCVIGWTNAALEVPVLDLHALFRSLSDPSTRFEHFWVAGMIFSTLVPTVVHLVIVALSAITWAPPRLRAWCEAGIGLRDVSGQAFTLSALVVSALYAVYALLLTWGLFKLAGAAMVGLSAAIPWYLRLVETVATALGAM